MQQLFRFQPKILPVRLHTFHQLKRISSIGVYLNQFTQSPLERFFNKPNLNSVERQSPHSAFSSPLATAKRDTRASSYPEQICNNPIPRRRIQSRTATVHPTNRTRFRLQQSTTTQPKTHPSSLPKCEGWQSPPRFFAPIRLRLPTSRHHPDPPKMVAQRHPKTTLPLG